jgi:hypothetical protein
MTLNSKDELEGTLFAMRDPTPYRALQRKVTGAVLDIPRLIGGTPGAGRLMRGGRCNFLGASWCSVDVRLCQWDEGGGVVWRGRRGRPLAT